ncbi:dTDP-4-dehydrorhamnose reductase [Membranihabitans maritimus]|uniref:dTDP-4-dehydrorhamnose reductase n=1 Tax=Membranihabitans maritimus TaxID=2904244 RepID=UPI001F003C69|nr:dTDP-4-dehydrorhamnose reductase [Membranihabitans maritimus]
MVRISVTGANGQLGKEIRNIHKDYAGIEFTFYTRTELDITNKDSLKKLKESKCDALINCAAYTAVDLAEDEIDKAYAINLHAVGNLADYCKNNNCTLIHVSTDYVYGESNTPHKEYGNINPLSIYGKSKWEGEEIIRSTLSNYYILRTSWLYSSFGNNFVKTMRRLAVEKNFLTVVNDQKGSPTYARDLAKGIMHVIVTKLSNITGNKKEYGTYNFSNRGATTWYEFAKKIIHKSDPDFPIYPVTSDEFVTKAKRPEYSVLDCSRFENTFAYKIREWEKALEECLELLNVEST